MNAVLRPLSNLTVKAMGAAGGGLAKGVDKVMDAATQPPQPLDTSLEVARLATSRVRRGGLALMPDDSPTA